MRFRNTSDYPTAEVRELVAIGLRGIDSAGVEIHVKNDRHGGFSGRAYGRIPGIANTASTSKVLVTLRIGATASFPRRAKYLDLKRAPEYLVRCWHDALVKVSAHEGHHVRAQRRRQRARRSPIAAFIAGSRAPRRIPHASEIAAERWAVKRLEEFRDTQLSGVGGVPGECQHVRQDVRRAEGRGRRRPSPRRDPPAHRRSGLSEKYVFALKALPDALGPARAAIRRVLGAGQVA